MVTYLHRKFAFSLQGGRSMLLYFSAYIGSLMKLCKKSMIPLKYAPKNSMIDRPPCTYYFCSQARGHSMTRWTQFWTFLTTSTWTFLTLNVDKVEIFGSPTTSSCPHSHSMSTLPRKILLCPICKLGHSMDNRNKLKWIMGTHGNLNSGGHFRATS